MFSPRMGGGGGIRQLKQSLPLGIWQMILAQERHLRCFSEKTEEVMKLCLKDYVHYGPKMDPFEIGLSFHIL